MTSDPSQLIKKVRQLNMALIVSGALNIAVLSLLLFWVLREKPPTPYCELKPAASGEQEIPLADQRGCAEVLAQLSKLPFSQLVNRLYNAQLIENGYAERDLALACMVAFHHFDFQRALPKNAQPQQSRLLSWKPKDREKAVSFFVYPDLTQAHYDSMIQFAKTERWPLTGEGLFELLKTQKNQKKFDDHLIETFVLTPQFWTVELLFNRSGQKASRQDILIVLLEGDWNLLQQFVDQQRQVHDSSDARRQKFLLDYIKAGSRSAAVMLLKSEWDFAVKKIDDLQVAAIIKLLPLYLEEGQAYAKEMLVSPRSTNVWREASQWLYTQAEEPMPSDWTRHAALTRFIPEKAALELVTVAPAPIATPLLIITPAVSKPAKAAPITLVDTSKVKSKIDAKNNVKTAAPVAKQTVAANTASSNAAKGKKVEKKNVAEKSKKPSAKENNQVAQANVVQLKPLIYVVQEADTLWKISRRFNVKLDEIKKLNELTSDVLKPGMTLKLPKQPTQTKSAKR